MDIVSIEMIEEAVNYFESLNEEQIQVIMDNVANKQAYLLTYLMASGETGVEKEKAEVFFYIGFVILYLMVEKAGDIPQVGEDEIEKHELKNTKFFELIEGEDEEAVFEFIDAAFKDYKQKELFFFVLESVYDEDELDELAFTDEEISIAILCFKTIIDCLDK